VRVRAAGWRGSALAFTGSSDTTRNVLIGFAALMLGTVLVVGSRRRKHANT
jgi:LPXTG-motif cell wall-anchored protein